MAETKNETNEKTIKIALVSLQKDTERVPPIGLVYLATQLNSKLKIPKKNIRIIDRNFDIPENEIREFHPDIVGISAMTIHYLEAIKLSQKIKEDKNIPVILGGVHISTLPKSLKKCFDVGVIGEGEETFSELIISYIKKNKFSFSELKKIKNIVYFKDNSIHITFKRAPLVLDDLPFPDFTFVNKNYFKEEEIPGILDVGIKYPILTARGCPYKCIFCSTSHFWGKTRFHSPDYIAKLIKKAIEDHNADYIKVMDDLFTVSPTRLEQIKIALEKQGVLSKIKGIECQPRANLVTEELCRKMKELHVKIVSFGFESGSDKILNWLKQGTVTVEMNKRALILSKKYGFTVYGSLIFGSPGETIEDMKKTLQFIDFAIKNKADYIWNFVATPYPGTLFWQIAEDLGKLKNAKLDLHNIENPLLLDESVSKQEFKKIFLCARKRLRILRFRLIKNFLIKNPKKTLKLFLKEPAYYFERTVKQIYKQ